MNWDLHIRKKAVKALKRFPRSDQERINGALKSIEHDPYSGDITSLDMPKTWRRRVGNYRIFYILYPEDRVVFVYAIKRRTSKTY